MLLMGCARQTKSCEDLTLRPESPTSVEVPRTIYTHHQLKGMKQAKRERVRDFVRRIDTAFVESYGLRDYPDADFDRFRRAVKKDSLLGGLVRPVWREFHSSYLFDSADEEDISYSELVEAVQNAEWVVDIVRHLTLRFVNEPVSQEKLTYPFHIDRDGFVRVYVAGFCSAPDVAAETDDVPCKAGIGVWFTRNHKLNLSEPLDDRDRPSTNAASLRAAIEAVKMARAWNIGRLSLCTYSKYLRDALISSLFRWLDNGWRRSSGKPVKHLKQWKELLTSVENMDVNWKYIKESSVHNEGIASAERLAREAADRHANTFLGASSVSSRSISPDSLDVLLNN